jgi:hypothetical protein
MIDIFFKDIINTDCLCPDSWVEFEEHEDGSKTPYIAEEWTSTPMPPVIGVAPDGEKIFHLLGTSEQAELLDGYGVLLGRGYYMFQSLHPEMAGLCAEAEYELNGVPGRCKVAMLPEGAVVKGVYAPSLYLGVNSPTEPLPPEVSISVIDKALQETKERLKPFSIGYIKTHPSCTDSTLLTAITNQYGAEDAGLAKKLIALYVQGSFEQGYIQEATFVAFRNWIVTTPEEILERL